jgi:hypothetical protein
MWDLGSVMEKIWIQDQGSWMEKIWIQDLGSGINIPDQQHINLIRMTKDEKGLAFFKGLLF